MTRRIAMSSAWGTLLASPRGMRERTGGSSGAGLASRWDWTSFGKLHSLIGGARVGGRAPTVVLVHGLVISSRYMVPTAQRLARHLDVLAPDLPGFGRSAKPLGTLDVPQLASALGEWIRVCGLRDVILVGNSLGCQVIAEFAHQRPERVTGVVLGGPSMDPAARSMLRQMLRAAVDAPRERLSLVPLWVGDFLRAGPRRSWRTLRYALEHRLEDKLPAMTMPTLVVRGSRDSIVSQRWAEQVTALLPKGTLRVIRDAPHALNYSTPDEFASLVRGFVARASSSPSAP